MCFYWLPVALPCHFRWRHHSSIECEGSGNSFWGASASIRGSIQHPVFSVMRGDWGAVWGSRTHKLTLSTRRRRVWCPNRQILCCFLIGPFEVTCSNDDVAHANEVMWPLKTIDLLSFSLSDWLGPRWAMYTTFKVLPQSFIFTWTAVTNNACEICKNASYCCAQKYDTWRQYPE